MNDELKETLRSVLKEELEPINDRIGRVESKVDQLTESVNKHHLENIKSDELILQSLSELKDNVRFLNRRVADTEMEMHAMKAKK